MLLNILLLVTGFVMLIFGADWLVSGASSLAKRYKVSDLAIGLTIVAFGTSMPELIVNTMAAVEGNSDIVFGNVIGSNLFNLLVILGIVGLIYPIAVKSSTIWKEIPISFFVVIILWFLVNGWLIDKPNILSSSHGALLLALFIAFLIYVFWQMKSDTEIKSMDTLFLPVWKISLLVLSGLFLLIFGGRLVIENAVGFASRLGVSERIIGLTIVAAGTSLPELVTSLMAALRRNSDIAIGNVIGSNIFNVLLILGASASIKPIQYNTGFNTDIYILLAGTLFLFVAMFTGTHRKLDRWEAAILLLAFIVYTVINIMS